MKTRSPWTKGLSLLGILFLVVPMAWAAPTIFVQDSFLKFGDTEGYIYVGIRTDGSTYDVAGLTVTLSIPDDSSGVTFVDAFYDPPALAYFSPPIPPNLGYVFNTADSADKSAPPSPSGPPNNPVPLAFENSTEFNNFVNGQPFTTVPIPSGPARVIVYSDISLNGLGTTLAANSVYNLVTLKYNLFQPFVLGTVPVTINPDPLFTNILLADGTFITTNGNNPDGSPGAIGGLGIQNGAIILPETSSVVLFSLILVAGFGYGLGRKKPVPQPIG